MFKEIRHVKQEAGAGRRRWFEADDCELVVWLELDGRVGGFQFCYDFGTDERALTWRAGAGFVHSVVDQGDATPFKNETPVLMPDGEVPWSDIRHRFEAHREGLDAGLRDFVRKRLAEGAAGTRRR